MDNTRIGSDVRHYLSQFSHLSVFLGQTERWAIESNMSKKGDATTKWRRSCKERIITAMGGKCCICGYNKCASALALHHLDPKEKDFSFGKMRANHASWSKIVSEVRKCVLICHNCHSEVHACITKVPDDPPRFNEEYAEYKVSEENKEQLLDPCPVCGKLKPSYLKNCSKECAGKSQYKVNWDTIDIVEELKTKSIVQLAEEIGCSDVAIHKRMKKLGLK